MPWGVNSEQVPEESKYKEILDGHGPGQHGPILSTSYHVGGRLVIWVKLRSSFSQKSWIQDLHRVLETGPGILETGPGVLDTRSAVLDTRCGGSPPGADSPMRLYNIHMSWCQIDQAQQRRLGALSMGHMARVRNQ